MSAALVCPSCRSELAEPTWFMRARQARLDLGISGADAARSFGISRYYLTHIESGRSAPGADLKRLMNDELGLEDF